MNPDEQKQLTPVSIFSGKLILSYFFQSIFFMSFDFQYYGKAGKQIQLEYLWMLNYSVNHIINTELTLKKKNS